MANQMKLDMSSYKELIMELDSMDVDVKSVIGRLMREAAFKISLDTKHAIAAANLPAGGTYSIGTTGRSINYFPQVEWEGNIGSVPVGFDFSLAGAGGFLISGTPRMAPDEALRKMYKLGGYMRAVHEKMWDDLWDEIDKRRS